MPTPQPTLQLWMTLKQIPSTAPASAGLILGGADTKMWI